MNYIAEKIIEYRLEEARRMQKNVDFVREACALRQRGPSATMRSLARRFTNWTEVRTGGETCDEGAA